MDGEYDKGALQMDLGVEQGGDMLMFGTGFRDVGYW